MIQNHPVNVLRIQRVIPSLGSFALILVSQANTEVSNNDVRRVPNLEGEIPESNAITGRCLARDSHLRFVQHQFALQLNRSRNVEYDRPGSARGPNALPQ